MDDRACESQPTTRELFWLWYVNKVKWPAFMFIHKYWWKTLYFIRLARPYSRTMCRLNLYRKYPDGRCMWCGEIHD